MKIDVMEASGITLIKPKGKLTIAGGDVALRECIEQTLDSGTKKILVDLGGVAAMDSSGLGELIASRKLCTDHGAEIKLLDVNQRINKVLTMTRLVGLFEIYEDEKTAVDSFS